MVFKPKENDRGWCLWDDIISRNSSLVNWISFTMTLYCYLMRSGHKKKTEKVMFK